MATRMQQRRGTAAQWTTANPVLNAGEIGYESDTNKFKIGDGDNHWADLSYFVDAIALGGNIDDYIPLTQRGSVNGVATLDANQSLVVPGASIIIEGVSSNDFETTLTVIDPAANRTITFPDATGTVQLRVANVSDTEIEYLNGVTSSIQTQINDKLSFTSGGVMNSPFSMGGYKITSLGAPTSDSDAATKIYVDNISSGINFHEAVHAASVNNLAVIYNNGTSGVGATLTADTNRAFSTLDGESVTVGQRVLIKNQTDAKQNGIYTLTAEGSVSAPWVLTRATDSDNNPVGEMKNGDFCLVINGEVNASYGFINNSTANPIIIGTSDITYIAFNSAKAISAGNGLKEETPGILSIDEAITQTRVVNVSDTEIGYLNGVTSSIQTQLDNKSTAAKEENLTNKTLTSPVISNPTGITKFDVDLANVDNTSDVNKPISTATQTALGAKLDSATASTTYETIANVALKAPSESPTFTGTVVLPSTTSIGTVSSTELGYVDGVTSSIQTQLNGKQAIVSGVSDVEIGYLDGVTSAIQTQINAKLATATASSTYAPLADPTFTGTVSGVTKAHVGLGNVDNTSDANKPVSTATQTALDAKASLAGAVFTGNVEVDGNLVVDGDFTVNGTNFNASATTITIEDNLLQLAHQNAANTVDLGLVVAYNDGTAKHSGLVRDVSDAKWKLFNGVTTEPTTTVNFGQGSLDALAVGALEATTVTASTGVVFTDGTQTKEGVASRTPIIQKAASYTLSALSERDSLIEVASGSATTITIPLNSAVAYPVGTSLDILQTSTGQVTIAGTVGVTVNATPGLKLRTQWSSATLFKRAENTWVVYGDLTA